MTRQPVNIEDVAARAQELADSRTWTVRDYAATVNAANEAREALAAREKEQRVAWRACLRAGWTERQLAATGLPKPPTGPGRPRKTAPADDFREPGIATGDGVLDVPAPEKGDPVVDQIEAPA